MADLGEQARRESRQKCELQARQELLFATQRQAEQERAYALKELELARSALSNLREDRLRLGQESLEAIVEAKRLALGAGIGPGVVQDLLSQSAGPELPHESRESRNPFQQRSRRNKANPYPDAPDDGVP